MDISGRRAGSVKVSVKNNGERCHFTGIHREWTRPSVYTGKKIYNLMNGEKVG